MTLHDVWNHASLLLSLGCALALAFFLVRWAVRNIPPESEPRRLAQVATIVGGLIGLVPGIVFGLIGGGDIGGAFMAIPFQFLLRMPPHVAGVIGLFLFLNLTVAVLTALGATAGYSLGHFLGYGARAARSLLRS